jgi:hypothetical protein
MSNPSNPLPSGEADHDAAFDAGQLFDVIEREEDVSRVLEAMREFLRRAETPLLERAVAVYIRAARARREPVEVVLAALGSLADELERDGTPGFAQRDTPMRHLVLRGVLLAFYGSGVVERETVARDERVERRARERKSPTD